MSIHGGCLQLAKAKGSTIVGAVMVLRKQKEAARRLLPVSLHHYLVERVQMASWYPEEDLLALIRALLELTPAPREDSLKAMGVATARSMGEGIYSHLMERSGTASSTFALWSTMHDSGKLKLRRNPAIREVFLELSDFASPSPEMCAITGAFIEESLRMSGHALVVRKDACVLSGDDVCRWKAI